MLGDSLTGKERSKFDVHVVGGTTEVESQYKVLIYFWAFEYGATEVIESLRNDELIAMPYISKHSIPLLDDVYGVWSAKTVCVRANGARSSVMSFIH